MRWIDHRRIVISLNEAQLRTLAQVGEILARTHWLERQPVAAEAGSFARIETVLKRFGY